MTNYLKLVIFFLAISSNAQQKKIIEYADGKIAYQEFGEGYPVLIINGGPGMNSNGFAPLAKMLSENNTTIIYDQRGTGDSEIKDLNASNMTIDLMIEDIETLRRELDYEQWIVLGHSFGGMLAYAYAAKYPKRLKAMIQSHSGGMDLTILEGDGLRSRLSTTERDSLNFYSARIRQGDNSKETALKRAEFLAPAYLYDKSLVPLISERLTQGNMTINGWIWNDLQQMNFDVAEKMKSFNKSVLILNGAEEAVPARIAERAHEIFPDSRLVIMPRCGHYGWLERPDIYLKEVKYFLKANSEQLN